MPRLFLNGSVKRKSARRAKQTTIKRANNNEVLKAKASAFKQDSTDKDFFNRSHSPRSPIEGYNGARSVVDRANIKPIPFNLSAADHSADLPDASDFDSSQDREQAEILAALAAEKAAIEQAIQAGDFIEPQDAEDADVVAADAAAFYHDQDEARERARILAALAAEEAMFEQAIESGDFGDFTESEHTEDDFMSLQLSNAIFDQQDQDADYAAIMERDARMDADPLYEADEDDPLQLFNPPSMIRALYEPSIRYLKSLGERVVTERAIIRHLESQNLALVHKAFPALKRRFDQGWAPFKAALEIDANAPSPVPSPVVARRRRYVRRPQPPKPQSCHNRLAPQFELDPFGLPVERVFWGGYVADFRDKAGPGDNVRRAKSKTGAVSSTSVRKEGAPQPTDLGNKAGPGDNARHAASESGAVSNASVRAKGAPQPMNPGNKAAPGGNVIHAVSESGAVSNIPVRKGSVRQPMAEIAGVNGATPVRQKPENWWLATLETQVTQSP